MKTMIIRQHLMMGVLVATVASGLASSCQDTDGTTAEAKSFTYSLLASADYSAEDSLAEGKNAKKGGKQTLALTMGADKLLKSAFEKGDYLLAYNLSDNDQSTLQAFSQLTAAGDGQKSDFDGSFTSKNRVKMTDEICFFYPGAAAVQGRDQSVASVAKVTEAAQSAGEESSTYYKLQPQIKRTVELNMTQQDGDLVTISHKFDYQWGKTNPISISGNVVKTKVGALKRLVSLWALRFTDENDRILTNIDSVYISEVRSRDVFDLGTGSFKEDAIGDRAIGVTISRPAGKLVTKAGGYVYAAFLPGNFSGVNVVVYKGNEAYYAEYENLSFEANKFYKSDILKMKPLKQEPYVEVQGIKWATGNFIRYQAPFQRKVYYGIAPAQWWISGYAIPNGAGGYASTQWQDGPRADANDLDLFRFGDIAKILDFTALYSRGGVYADIVQKFYTAQGVLGRQTNFRDEAKTGDLPWYYTMEHRHRYRNVTRQEMDELTHNAHVLPAYCYTDKGTVVYGAYYWTNTGTPQSRFKGFPYGKKTITRFLNATSLVRLNKGLFLPFTGHRKNGSDKIVLRNMGAPLHEAPYASGAGAGVAQSWKIRFASRYYGTAFIMSEIACAIRPVYVDEVLRNPENTYPPFRNIR